MRSLNTIIYTTLLLLTLGCESNTTAAPESSTTIQDVDLSGIWLQTDEIRRYKKDTEEYLESSFSKSIVIFDDTENGVAYKPCGYFSSVWPYGYGVKTETKFYLDLTESGYELKSDGSLSSYRDHGNEYQEEWEPDFRFDTVSLLKRMDGDEPLDNGHLILRGPVAIDEQFQVCTTSSQSTIGIKRDIGLTVPYGNGRLTLSLRLIGDITPGDYEYTDSGYPESIELSIYADSKEFYDITGSSNLNPDNIQINITVSNENTLSGTFSFLDRDEAEYDGEFEVNYLP